MHWLLSADNWRRYFHDPAVRSDADRWAGKDRLQANLTGIAAHTLRFSKISPACTLLCHPSSHEALRLGNRHATFVGLLRSGNPPPAD